MTKWKLGSNIAWMRRSPDQVTECVKDGFNFFVAGNASLPELGQAVKYYPFGPEDHTGIFVHSYGVGWNRVVAIAALFPFKYSLFTHGELIQAESIRSKEIGLKRGESIMIASPGVEQVLTPEQIQASLRAVYLNPAEILLHLAYQKNRLDPTKEAVLVIRRTPNFLSRFRGLTTALQVRQNKDMPETPGPKGLLTRRNVAIGGAAGVAAVALRAGVALTRPSPDAVKEVKNPLEEWPVHRVEIPVGGGILGIAVKAYGGEQPMHKDLLMQKIYRASGLKNYQAEQSKVEIVIPNLDPNVETVGLNVGGKEYVPGLEWQLQEVAKNEPKFTLADKQGNLFSFQDGQVYPVNGRQLRFTVLRDNSQYHPIGDRVSVEVVPQMVSK